MLKLLNANELAEIQNFCRNSIIGTRICSYALAYGFDKSFLMFWGDKDEYGFITIVAKFDSTMSILTTNKTDFDELAEFIDIIGTDEIITDDVTAEYLRFFDYGTKQGFIFNSDINTPIITDDPSEDDFREIYNLICTAIPHSFTKTKEAYLSFLSDFVFRANRGYAKAKCIKNNGKVVACALTSAQSDSSALLSGIACGEEYRKYGYGRQVVMSLTYDLTRENKKVYVIALNESAEGFYKHIGFKECEKIALIKRKV